jgi:hypothetical protein
MEQGLFQKPAVAQVVNITSRFHDRTLRNYATSQKVAGSIPDEAIGGCSHLLTLVPRSRIFLP